MLYLVVIEVVYYKIYGGWQDIKLSRICGRILSKIVQYLWNIGKNIRLICSDLLHFDFWMCQELPCQWNRKIRQTFSQYTHIQGLTSALGRRTNLVSIIIRTSHIKAVLLVIWKYKMSGARFCLPLIWFKVWEDRIEPILMWCDNLSFGQWYLWAFFDNVPFGQLETVLNPDIFFKF